jgi:DNA-binding phage protein
MKAVKLQYGLNDGIFGELKDILTGYNLESVADLARCAHGTLYNWMSGKTRSPRLCTMINVAKAVGYTLKLTRVTSKPTLRIVK